jgi:transposase-like protein
VGGRRRAAEEKREALRAAETLGVAEACRRAGCSRDALYGWRRALKAGGEAGLRPTPRRGKPLLKLRVPPEVEARVLELTRQHPEWGKQRLAGKTWAWPGESVSRTAVLAVWLRNGVGTTAPARSAWAAAQQAPQRRREVECPACWLVFVAAGEPPHTCPRCGVGGVNTNAPRKRAAVTSRLFVGEWFAP